MSSVAQLCRASARLTSRTAGRKASSRGFSRSAAPCAAQNFNLPSLSPTMTEGGISSWKVKEGDSFSAGDVLLEIETDKAQMDVEAQDDGKVFKILEKDGAKGIQVGKRIAVFAEAEDDLSSLEMPAEESNPQPEKKGEASLSANEEPSKEKETDQTPSSPPKEAQETAQSPSSSSSPKDEAPSHGKPASQKYPLYPSVQVLLHTAGVSSSDVSKIPATGPNGRLLKGDVLSYLGKIEKDYSSSQSTRIAKMGHLDLSNITKSVPKVDPNAAKETKKSAAVAPAAEVEPDTQVAVPISLAAVFATQRRLQDSLGITLPLSTFIARASEIANQDLPRANTAATADELFDSILGLDKVKPRKTTSKGRYVPQITALPAARTSAPPAQRTALLRQTPTAAARKTVDILDSLISGSTKAASAKPASRAAGSGLVGGSSLGAVGADNVFTVTAKKGEEKRARVYLERVKMVLEAEPGSCVL